MKYAVIQLLGKQHKVAPGDLLTIDAWDKEVGEEIEISDVLLKVDGEKVLVGTPLVAGAKVTVKVVEAGKGRKIRVLRYRSKSRHRRTIGHRSRLTNIEILKV
jgi:large subunit ribosomal protein L21